MDIYDETSNSLAHTVTAGPATELVAGQVIDLSLLHGQVIKTVTDTTSVTALN